MTEIMQPGRELDAAVWRALGYEVVGVSDEYYLMPDSGNIAVIPTVSTSDAGMGVLIDEMLKRRFCVRLESRWDDRWIAMTFDADSRLISVEHGITRAHAVALAALEALKHGQ